MDDNLRDRIRDELRRIPSPGVPGLEPVLGRARVLKLRRRLVEVAGVIAVFAAIGLPLMVLLPLGESPTPATLGGATEPGVFTARQVFVRGDIYIEGAISYLRLETDDGQILAEEAAPYYRSPGPRLSRKLVPGDYRVVSFLRPCSGNCGLLDDPTDLCRQTFGISWGEQVEATVMVRPGQGCSIDIDRTPGPRSSS